MTVFFYKRSHSIARTVSISVAAILSLAICSKVKAEEATALNNLAQIPVREVTVFKDGHALVLHRGMMQTDKDGNVVMDQLPKPVLGTFWPFSSDSSAKLNSAVAGIKRVSVPNTSLTVAELIEGNLGAEVVLSVIPENSHQATELTYEGVIESIPTRSSKELEETSEKDTGKFLPRRGDVVLVRTSQGLKAEPLSRIKTVTFKGDMKGKLSHEELRNLITMKLDWQNGKPQSKADVGMMYLERGIRWIPSYKVTIDGEGKAKIQLNATIENRLRDLDDVKFDLVVGVPNFPFQNQVDPIALNGTVADVVRNLNSNSMIASQFSNAAVLQGATNGTIGRQAGNEYSVPVSALSLPGVKGAGKSEDMFVFTVDHVTLKKGERMVLPVKQYEVQYKDIYKLSIPFGAPADVRRNHSDSLAKYERALKAPKVMHRLRLCNTASQPFTTAPALLVSLGKDKVERVLAQSLMTYTAPGGDVDLDLSTAIDLRVTKEESEISRLPDAVKWQDDKYCRVNLDGTIGIKNYGNKTVKLEVDRQVFGSVDSATAGGKFKKVNFFEQGIDSSGNVPYWWSYYRWPNWWHHINGSASIKWSATLQPGQSTNLTYKWHYFWR